MRTITLATAALGALIASSAPTPATALPLNLEGTAIQIDDESMVQQVRRGGGRGGGGYRGGYHRPVGGYHRPGHVYRPIYRRGVAVAAGVGAWRVGWVGSGYYYNPAYYDRYYHPSYGYCRIRYYQGRKVCKWYRQRWW